MSELPNRKPQRLCSHDYSENGAYFVTFCVKDHLCILADVKENPPGSPQILLTDLGNESFIHKDEIKALSSLKCHTVLCQ